MQQLWVVTEVLCESFGLLQLWRMCPMDLKEREILGADLVILAALCAGTGLCRVIGGKAGGYLELSLALAPGILILLLGRVRRGSLGAGDGILFLAMGLGLRPAEVYELAQLTFLSAAVVGLLLRGRRSLPLVPFAAAARSIQLMGRWFGG